MSRLGGRPAEARAPLFPGSGPGSWFLRASLWSVVRVPLPRLHRPPDRVSHTGSMMEFIYLNKMKNFEERAHRESDTKFYHLVQVGPIRAGGWLLPQSPVTSKAWDLSDPLTSPAHFMARANGGLTRPGQGSKLGIAKTLTLFPGKVSLPLQPCPCLTHLQLGGVTGSTGNCRFLSQHPLPFGPLLCSSSLSDNLSWFVRTVLMVALPVSPRHAE